MNRVVEGLTVVENRCGLLVHFAACKDDVVVDDMSVTFTYDSKHLISRTKLFWSAKGWLVDCWLAEVGKKAYVDLKTCFSCQGREHAAFPPFLAASLRRELVCHIDISTVFQVL